MQKCAKCDATIVMGAEEYAGRLFCSRDCISKLLIEIAEQNVTPADLDARTQEMFQGGCPVCNAQRPIDVYSATKITGMILAVQVSTDEQISCASCARKFKFGAFAHCLFLGWWSPKALFFNIFLIPISLISTIFTMEAQEPSKELRDRVKAIIGDAILMQNQ